MSRFLTTADLPVRERRAFWADAVCDAYVQLDCQFGRGHDGSRRPFRGEIRIDTLPGIELSRVTSNAQQVSRTPGLIARASEDFFLVSIQTRGRGVISQDGRSARLGPGDFALYDSTRPYQLSFDADFQQYVVMLPGKVLRGALARTEALTARTVSGRAGAGHLMIRMIRMLADDIATLEPTSAMAVGQSVEQILIAGLSALAGAEAPPVSKLTALYRAQIQALVKAELRDPDLDVALIARRLGLSTSTVHRAFAGEGQTLSEWIWAQRLDGARRDLVDPRSAGRSVSTIAFGWGFSDAAHFSRAFRARFGCPPSTLRVRRPARP